MTKDEAARIARAELREHFLANAKMLGLRPGAHRFLASHLIEIGVGKTSNGEYVMTSDAHGGQDVISFVDDVLRKLETPFFADDSNRPHSTREKLLKLSATARLDRANGVPPARL